MARRYEFYLRAAARTIISHSFAALTRGILSLPREHKIYIFELTCNVYINILMTAFLMIFRRLPTTFPIFPKIFQTCSEGQMKVLEHFPIIYENFRRFPRKTQICFDDTPANLSTNLNLSTI